MPQHVISIAEDGNARTLWTEAIDLAELGTLKVSRASNVEFNDDAQRWEVWFDEDFEPVFWDKSRECCLSWERIEANRRLMEAA